MSVSTLADYLAALKETVSFQQKTGTANPPVSSVWYSAWDGTGVPAAGSLSVGNTANGLVPTDATTGAPTINFGSGSGYVTAMEYQAGGATAALAARWLLYDRLFHAGSYAHNSGTTNLATQPSFSSRVPGGTDYTGLQIWVEVNTTIQGASGCTITYTDQSGNTGHTTNALSLPTLTASTTAFRMALAAGDSGVSKIESVAMTSATAGSVNVLIVRPLVIFAASNNYTVYRRWLDTTGAPQVWGDSCLGLMYNTTTSNARVMTLDLEIASN